MGSNQTLIETGLFVLGMNATVLFVVSVRRRPSLCPKVLFYRCENLWLLYFAWQWVKDMADAGANMYTFHLEATSMRTW